VGEKKSSTKPLRKRKKKTQKKQKGRPIFGMGVHTELEPF